MCWVITLFFATLSDCKKNSKGKGKKCIKEKAALKKNKSKRQRGAQKKRKSRTRKNNSEVFASFVFLCRVVLLLAWTRSRTSLGQRHRLAWDYFSVLQFWIEIIDILCYHIVLTQSSTYILLSAQVHLATVTLKLDNRLYHPVGFGKNTCKTVISRLRYCFLLSPLPSSC